MANKQVRQGHILLNPVSTIPKTAQRQKPTRPGEIVIASGESGREHLFKSNRVEIFQEGANVYIEVLGEGPVFLEHPEHGDIAVEPGKYMLIEQREAGDGEINHGSPVRRSYD